MPYPKVDEDGSVKRAPKGDALAAAFSCDAQSPAWCGEASRRARQSGQTGGRVSFLLSLCFVSRENDSSAACFPGADGQRGISG